MPTDRIIVGQRVAPTKLERAKELRRSMTNEERILWERLRGNRSHGLHFRRQQVIDGLIVDFYCHAAGLGIEVDGGIHQSRSHYDDERDRVLAAHGLRILRVKNQDVRNNLAGVLEMIAGVCRDLTP